MVQKVNVISRELPRLYRRRTGVPVLAALRSPQQPASGKLANEGTHNSFFDVTTLLKEHRHIMLDLLLAGIQPKEHVGKSADRHRFVGTWALQESPMQCWQRSKRPRGCKLLSREFPAPLAEMRICTAFRTRGCCPWNATSPMP